MLEGMGTSVGAMCPLYFKPLSGLVLPYTQTLTLGSGFLNAGAISAMAEHRPDFEHFGLLSSVFNCCHFCSFSTACDRHVVEIHA